MSNLSATCLHDTTPNSLGKDGRKRHIMEPERSLLAAVALRAVRDALTPPKHLPPWQQQDAYDFVRSDGVAILLNAGITASRISAVLDASHE